MNYDTLRHIATQLSQAAEELEQGGVTVDRIDYSSLPKTSVLMAELMKPSRKNEGGVCASVAGCNANNDNAGRTLNANNAATNDNNNYAGGFAHNNNYNLLHIVTSRPNTTDDYTATGEYRPRDYRDVPYWDSDGESEVSLNIWDELERANSKRNLSGLRKFLLNREVAIFAVLRTAYRRDTEEKHKMWENPLPIAIRMIRELEDMTYIAEPPILKRVDKQRKTDKERQAEVFTLYDRCMVNLVLTVIEQKLRRKVPRTNYSNIIGRSILCNDRRFCMMTRIRHASKVYKDLWYLTDDIHKFYQSLQKKVYLGVLFQTIKDPLCRWLLCQVFAQVEDLPIGSSLSPIIAGVVMAEYDKMVQRDFNVSFSAAFGDNRIYFGEHDELERLKSFQISYYAGRYSLDLKGDWQKGKVVNGLRFCKTWYRDGFVNVRGEMRRRAIRAANKPQQFAGYNGLLLKSDSKRLLSLIRHNLKRLRKYRTMNIRPFRGEKCKMDRFVGQRVAIVDFRKIDNHKDSGYYFDFQIISKEVNKDGKENMHLWHCHNGSFEIKQICDKWLREKTSMPQYRTIGKDGNSVYFQEDHIDDREACNIIVQEMGIEL